MIDTRVNRRGFLTLGATAAATALAARAGVRGAWAQSAPAPRPYLFVIAAMGGASMLDAFLPVPESTSPSGTSLIALPDAVVRTVAGSAFRCVAPLTTGSAAGYRYDNSYAQDDFLRRHGQDLAVMTVDSTSVNHAVAQHRALSGDGVNAGRMITEAVAARWGDGLVLPSCNMASGNYTDEGTDLALPADAQQVSIADPRYFALSTDGYRGVVGAPDPALVARARAARTRLEQSSRFGRTFGATAAIQRYLGLRHKAEQMEAAGLISKLMIAGDEFPLAQYGIAPSPLADRMASAFPNMARDSFESQAALAFLLARYNVASAVTLSPEANVLTRAVSGTQQIVNTQLAFDYSHTDHRVAQNTMWSRILRVADALIALLKEQDVDGDPAQGKMWDRSVVYIATEFGRDKSRGTAGAQVFGTAHHQNNAVAIVSPRVRGNRVYGGVDPATCLTYGFDRTSGEPRPGTTMTMRDVYSVVAAACGVEFTGRTEVPCMVRA